MRLQKTVVADKPLARVFDYLSDFTSTTEWDPGTVVEELVPGERIRLRGENKTVCGRPEREPR
jgi:hypothetical protein